MSFPKKDIPTLEQAITYIEEAKVLNPGPWVKHSYNVATAAKTIASQIDGMDEDVAWS